MTPALSNIEERLGFDGWTPFVRRGPCPLSPDVVVRVKFRTIDGGSRIATHPYKASELRWKKFPDQTGPLPGDVVAYRIEGKA